LYLSHKIFLIIFADGKNMHFGPFLAKKHGFDRLWVILTPFEVFSIIFANAKNMQFGPFLAKKHGL
jgi:hypothetical protein